jgi:NAD+ synthase (glutamine-hydrolysing)
MRPKSPFNSPYAHGFVRVGVTAPRMTPADPAANAEAILTLVRRAHVEQTAVLVFPELCLSAYAIDDLHLQETLLSAVEREIERLCAASAALKPLFVVGAPLRWKGLLYNCALVIHRGEIVGVTPKTYLPNYREFYEDRWFTSGAGIVGQEIEVAGRRVPFGVDLLYRSVGSCPFTAHVEICEDLWAANPPSGFAAVAGAELLLNLTASNITIGKARTRRLLCEAQSARCLAAYAYAAAGPGESTTDLAWDGQTGVFEVGDRLCEGERFAPEAPFVAVDVDLGRIRAERIRQGSFGDGRTHGPAGVTNLAWRTVKFALDAPEGEIALRRPLERFPFVPSNPERLREDCQEAWDIQVQGLAERLRRTGLDKLVIGVSGGLDSTEALVVCVKAMARLGLPCTNVLAYTLPGFATSDATKANAWALMKGLGVTAAEIDITKAARQMLADMDHPFAAGQPVYDVTFENVQAGLRTDYLFRLANQHGAIVVGTGDLSELGLGWCTYGVGDQMSHYNPNAGVSKTLIQHLIRFAANSGDFDPETSRTLHAILETEISPELVPQNTDGGEGGTGPQSTQAVVGPYALQDFNLYYLTRYGYRPSKIAYLAWNAWRDAAAGAWPKDIPPGDQRSYDLPEIKRWLRLFLHRFFANQFKRSALPNGPKISSGGSLSPRGDWRMPSDASAAAWLRELDEGVPD